MTVRVGPAESLRWILFGGFISSSVMSVMNQAYSRLNSAKVKDGLFVVERLVITPSATARSATGTTTAPWSLTQSSGTRLRKRWEELMAMGNELLRLCAVTPGCRFWPKELGMEPDVARHRAASEGWRQAAGFC